MDDRFYILVSGNCAVERHGSASACSRPATASARPATCRAPSAPRRSAPADERHGAQGQLDAARAGVGLLPAALQPRLPALPDRAPAGRGLAPALTPSSTRRYQCCSRSCSLPRGACRCGGGCRVLLHVRAAARECGARRAAVAAPHAAAALRLWRRRRMRARRARAAVRMLLDVRRGCGGGCLRPQLMRLGLRRSGWRLRR